MGPPKKAKGGGATAKSSKGKKSLLQDGPGKGEADGGPPGLLEDIDGAGPGLLSAFVASYAPTELSAVMCPPVEDEAPAPAAKPAAAAPGVPTDTEVQELTPAEAAAAEKKRFKFSGPYGGKDDIQLLYQLGPHADEAMANDIAFQDPILYKNKRPGVAERWAAVAVVFARKTGAAKVPGKDVLSRRVTEVIEEAREWYKSWGKKDQAPTGNSKTTRLVNGKVEEWPWQPWMGTAMDIYKRRTAAEEKVDEIKVNSAKKREAGAHLALLRRQLQVATSTDAKAKLLTAINQAKTDYLTTHVKVEEGIESDDEEGDDDADGLRGGGLEGGADVDELGRVAPSDMAAKKRKRSGSRSTQVDDIVAQAAAQRAQGEAMQKALREEREAERQWQSEERAKDRALELEKTKVMMETFAGMISGAARK